MPKVTWHPASGTGVTWKMAKNVIRIARHGCTNRPFFHVVVTGSKRVPGLPPIEQLGTYDPIPNTNNEKLVSLNFERIQYWIAKGAHMSTPVAELLGLCGFYPKHPRSYMTAWRNREAAAKAAAAGTEQEAAAAEAN